MNNLPLVIAGPILRRVSTQQLTIWLATTSPVDIKLELYPENEKPQYYVLDKNTQQHTCVAFSQCLQYQLLNIKLSTPLPTDQRITYDLSIKSENDSNTDWQNITELLPHLLYSGQDKLQFCIPSHVQSLLHGSCRKPHHTGQDGLVIASDYLQNVINSHGESEHTWPSMLIMSGDQIYADDVAGPMLNAIHQLTERLVFPEEKWHTSVDNATEMTSKELYQHPCTYYQRSQLLPYTETNQGLVQVLFGGSRKPIFTSTSAENHLITLGEYLACYLLSWSATPWSLVNLEPPNNLTDKQTDIYIQEKQQLDSFVSGLNAVQRVMAHLPTAMIMDDHDITDDFNLHRYWEETVYSHPLSKKMIGNGLVAYLVNQAWGNRPEVLTDDLLADLQTALQHPHSPEYDSLIDLMFKFEGWDFDWPTSPPLIALDTRTRRWRSERSPYKPSGLLDWEALTELQSRLSGHNSVLLVSPAPIFGVKVIEVIQRIFTFFGHPLTVDAEYWMAHPGTAHGILNVFSHRKTPHNFVILSGDVHYSFVYDIELKGERNSPHIWQVCSSGLRNTFPEPLLSILDKLNRWLYSPKSPLNWFTRRRKMRITPRKPLGTSSGRRLFNHSGIGLVKLDKEGKPLKIEQLIGGEHRVAFEPRTSESTWQ